MAVPKFLKTVTLVAFPINSATFSAKAIPEPLQTISISLQGRFNKKSLTKPPIT